eukprot:CAMPEP_0115013196 /NCGR_PEP_ID=MMETSP0216-20121206/25250_1 /TAXON_ID=223996 /ORGANISM="Protocruzia adherens, Strain Boccale" /LENGTH=628 /DNA_ID=CAMNT_0002382521 /DNA_START=893 /DNA_END=2779 /DNA_ORIENTATION=-
MTTSAGFDLLEGILPKDEHQDQVQHEMQTDSTYSSSNHLAQRTDLDESLSKESGDADSRRQSDSRKSGSSRQDGDDLNSTGGSERANSASQETSKQIQGQESSSQEQTRRYTRSQLDRMTLSELTQTFVNVPDIFKNEIETSIEENRADGGTGFRGDNHFAYGYDVQSVRQIQQEFKENVKKFLLENPNSKLDFSPQNAYQIPISLFGNKFEDFAYQDLIKIKRDPPQKFFANETIFKSRYYSNVKVRAQYQPQAPFPYRPMQNPAAFPRAMPNPQMYYPRDPRSFEHRPTMMHMDPHHPMQMYRYRQPMYRYPVRPDMRVYNPEPMDDESTSSHEKASKKKHKKKKSKKDSRDKKSRRDDDDEDDDDDYDYSGDDTRNRDEDDDENREDSPDVYSKYDRHDRDRSSSHSKRNRSSGDGTREYRESRKSGRHQKRRYSSKSPKKSSSPERSESNSRYSKSNRSHRDREDRDRKDKDKDRRGDRSGYDRGRHRSSKDTSGKRYSPSPREDRGGSSRGDRSSRDGKSHKSSSGNYKNGNTRNESPDSSRDRNRGRDKGRDRDGDRSSHRDRGDRERDRYDSKGRERSSRDKKRDKVVKTVKKSKKRDRSPRMDYDDRQHKKYKTDDKYRS